MDIKDIITILNTPELFNLFTPEQQRQMYLIVQQKAVEYINAEANKTQQNGYEDATSSFTLK